MAKSYKENEQHHHFYFDVRRSTATDGSVLSVMKEDAPEL
jgi:predicted RNA-binding protein associated with RNAse of E/G family